MCILFIVMSMGWLKRDIITTFWPFNCQLFDKNVCHSLNGFSIGKYCLQCVYCYKSYPVSNVNRRQLDMHDAVPHRL